MGPAPADGGDHLRTGLIALASLLLGGAAPSQPQFAHAIVIVFENKTSVSAHDAPELTSLQQRYVKLANYHGVTHPSLPNYLALVSGSTHGITTDCTDCVVRGPTIASEVDTVLYAEGYPSSSRFAKKHAPFLYFPHLASRVQPLARFRADALPQLAIVVPDLCHDMHDCPVATGDAWLRRFAEPLLALPDTAIFVVFDEGYAAGNLVPAAVAGTAVAGHAVVTRRVDHYGLLRTLEDAFGVPPLGAAKSAQPIVGIWK